MDRSGSGRGREQHEQREAGPRAWDDGAGAVHIVGIGGRGMAGLAQWLLSSGVAVTGSEAVSGPVVDRLRRLGARVATGPRPARLPAATGLVVHAPGTPTFHTERLRAVRLGLPRAEAADVLDRLAAGSICVACHGRDGAGLAAALAGWTLLRTGLDPTVLLGNAAPQLGGWCRRGGGPHLVVESCLPGVTPDLLALLGHAADGAAGRLATRALLGSIPASGYLAAWGGPGLEGLLKGVAVTTERLGVGRRGLDWSAAEARDERCRRRLRVFRRGRFALEVRPREHGPATVPGTLAAVAIAARLGVDAATIREAIEDFEGPVRRLATLGSYRGARLIDDEAEGPRGVAEALACCRRTFAPRHLFVAYQGTSWPATPRAMARLGAALAGADAAWAVGAPSPLIRAWRVLGLPAQSAAGPVAAALDVSRQLGPGDLLLTLGAAAVGKVADEFLRRLPGRRQAG